MPSVGMRRSTRVFGARVLRSGRRLWTGRPEVGKCTRAAEGNSEWIKLVGNPGDGGDNMADCGDDTRDDLAGEVAAEPEVQKSKLEQEMEAQDRDRMHGLVYCRKRKRVGSRRSELSEDKRFGKQYSRRQWRKKCKLSEGGETCRKLQGSVVRHKELVIAVSELTYNGGYWTASLLNSVLRYMSRIRIGLHQLSTFLFSEPIVHAYASQGIRFLQGSKACSNRGFCRLLEARSFIPMFTLDYSAIPVCFISLQLSACLRSERRASILAINGNGDELRDAKKSSLGILFEGDQPENAAVSMGDDSGGRELLPSTVEFPTSIVRNLQLRNSRGVQKRRTSLRSRRGRPPSGFGAQKRQGALGSDLKSRQVGCQITPTGLDRVLATSAKKSSSTNMKELKDMVEGLRQDIGATSCSANILVIESDKCYREEGATVTLELFSAHQWFLVVKMDGVKRYRLAAQKVMRPPTSNRFTHDVIWLAENGWKLEFPSKGDWLIFKELYKECSDRNMQTPVVSVIPVPGVNEVSGYVDGNQVPFVRPESYISVKDDELSRVLAKRTATYDMDSDDDEWLNKFNTEICAGNELQEPLAPDNFELIIDALEKGYFCDPDNFSEEKADDNICIDLERKEVVEAVRGYWIKKRRQKRVALLRVFQFYQPRKIQVIPKSVLRKKRSFKRQGSQAGRGKQRSLLQAMAAERDAVEQQNNLLKVQEAKAAADRSEDVAVLKRQRAQKLMENADLATYKALMALKIAEAARVAGSPDDVPSLNLD